MQPHTVTILAQRYWPDVHGGVETHLWQMSQHLATAGVRTRVRTENRGKHAEFQHLHPLLDVWRRPPAAPGRLWRWLPLVQMNFWRRWLAAHPPQGPIWASNPCLGAAVLLVGRHEQLIYNPAGCAAAMRDIGRRHPHVTTMNLPRVTEWMDRFAYRFAPRVVVSSENVRHQFEQWYGARPQTHVVPLATTPCGDPPDRHTARQRWHIADNALVIGFVGRLDPCKGIDFLFEAMVLAHLPADARILMVGEGPDERRLRNLAQTLDIADRIIWTGRLDNPDEAYAAMDALALPSIYEAFGMVALEAMAAGVPVLGRRGDGESILTACDEIIGHGRDGFVVHSHHPRDLAGRMNDLSRSPQLRRDLSTAARQSAATRSWHHYVQRLFDLSIFESLRESYDERANRVHREAA